MSILPPDPPINPLLPTDTLFLTLRQAIPYIAKVTGGYATITDAAGLRLCTVDSQGFEHPELVGKHFQQVLNLAKDSGIVGSDFSKQAQSWILPLGQYILASSNIERVVRDQELQAALIQALPHIARIVGGEAVMFNAEGKRLASYTYEGRENTQLIGKFSPAAKEAMQTNRPAVGPSTSEEGAVAVRFPISKSFGLGFNNEQSVKHQKILLNEVRKVRNARYSFTDISGTSPSIVQVKNLAETIAKGESTIIIYGETGTGKELFAQSIHNASKRAAKPFVAINCGAIPESLIESHLFGYEAGSFTGAKKGGNAGALESAHGGTLFLDEISELDIALQSKLLRVLQEREIVRIGGVKPISTDIRILAATNLDLKEMVRNNQFREDLFYRLNVVQLIIPPLRERDTDVIALTRSFILRNNTLFGKFVLSITPKALQILQNHTWPGNVRELQNCIEYCFNLIDPKEHALDLHHLPSYLRDAKNPQTPNKPAEVPTPKPCLTLSQALLIEEQRILQATLDYCHGNRTEAAKILGLSLTTLWRRLKATT